MATKSESSNHHYKTGTLTGDEIVISGISGNFPSSNSANEFMENLFNKVDMVSAEDLHFEHPELPKYLGRIAGINKFDAQFFKVTYQQAISLDPMTRKLMEHAYTAMYDSGINPLQCRGTKIGVYVGSANSDFTMCLYASLNKNGFIVSGTCQCMLANRISYFMDGKAPSYALSCDCASSMISLERAYNDLKTGICEAALVGGCQQCINPIFCLNMKRTGVLCLDGKTKCFDKNGDGYVRADAINILFLQKAKDAKRIYSEILYAKATYSLRPDAEFIPMREAHEIENFLREFYSEAGVSPDEVEYVEAHGLALADADANELQAISEIFAKNKTIKVGCVKSNMGNSEPASGVCGLTKLCLSYHKGKIPANINYTEPLDIPAIKEGKLDIVKENTHFNRGFTAINNFSFSGVNTHVLLKGHFIPKDCHRYISSIPRLVLISGRTEKAIESLFDKLKNAPIDAELVGMMHNIYKVDTPEHTYKGHIILDTNENNETVSLSQSVNLCQEAKRPLCFVFSGMGSQWVGMGKELMKIPIFAAAIERCNKVLIPKGINICRIISEFDDKIFDNSIHCFVGIAAVQMGLIDILKTLGIEPDCFIGHSLGEFGCAYYDNCFTAEQMILAAYTRGKVSVEAKTIKGSMAAVKLGYNEIAKCVPPEIDIACHNSFESSTISGPAEVVKKFVLELRSRGVFAKEISSGNIAYHSRYISSAGPKFLELLNEIITPIQRSEKWLSSSVLPEKWNSPEAKFSSPQYHSNNFLSPVCFEEAAKKIPKNAIVVEVAAHGLLQAVLKRSHPHCLHVSLTKRNHPDPVKFLLEGLGILYQNGYNSHIDVLYPKIEFPVSTETPLISHFVEWYHEENWYTALITDATKKIDTSIRRFLFSVEDDDYKFIADHVIEGTIIFPASAILILLWETFAMYKKVDYRKMSVSFHNVHFYNNIIIDTEKVLRLQFAINKGNNNFEVSREDILIASGVIDEVKKPECNCIDMMNSVAEANLTMTSEDIYKIMQIKGYCYGDEFQTIESSSSCRNSAQIKWRDNWITFLDGLIQLNILAKGYNGISTLKLIKKITINVREHNNVNLKSENQCFQAELLQNNGITRCGGVEIRDIIFEDEIIQEQEPDVIKTLNFVPFKNLSIKMEEAIEIISQIVTENISTKTIEILEITDYKTEIVHKITSLFAKTCEIDFNTSNFKQISQFMGANLIIAHNFLQDRIYKNYEDYLENDCFVLTIEDTECCFENINLNIVSNMYSDGKHIVLLRKIGNVEDHRFVPVINDDNFLWISCIQKELKESKKVILVSENQPLCGLYGCVKKFSKEFNNKIALIVIDDPKAPAFTPEHRLYENQLKNNMVFNIFKKGQWGSYYYMRKSPSATCEMNIKLAISRERDLNSLKWIENTDNTDVDNLVKVCFAGPSLRDAQKAVGIIKTENKGFGMDFSGIDSKGCRVMGLLETGALASTVKPDPDLLWPVPDHWTLEEAATVPLAYAFAYYCLVLRSNLESGQIVFITDGAGALGQAVIALCLSINCTVYTCVGDASKKKILLKLFPELKSENIGSSYDDIFYFMMKFKSNKQGCDIIINCMDGYMREVAKKCSHLNGKLLDVSKYDMTRNADFGMQNIHCKSFQAVDMATIFKTDNFEEKKIIHNLISEGIANGTVKPITHVTYPVEEVTAAFRVLSLNKNLGRILFSFDNTDMSTTSLKVLRRVKYSSTGTYLVICDEDVLGVELANHLVSRGVKNLIIHTKSGSSYLNYRVSSWKKLGANITISTDPLQSENDCVKLLKWNTPNRIDGIFIAKEISADKNCGPEECIRRSKELTFVAATLDRLSRTYCPTLRYFVIFSPIRQNIFGEYTASVMEKICVTRSEIGLPALFLHAHIIKGHLDDINSNIQPQTISTLFNAMETCLRENFNNVLTYNNNKNKNDFMTRICEIFGLDNIDKLDKETMIGDIVTNVINIEELKKAINDHTKLGFSTQNIKIMTIERLKSLNNSITEVDRKFDDGLGAFYTMMGTHEMEADDEVVVPMTTIVSNPTTSEHSLDENETYLILVPGFEGYHHIFKSICERIKLKAITLQLLPDFKDKTVETMAETLKQLLEKKIKIRSKFYLFGYSFGVNVALEIAALFERDGLTGVVFCLDSSPDALRAQLDAYLGRISDEELQNEVLKHLFKLMDGQNNETLDIKLENAATWSEKVNTCLQRLKKNASHTTQYNEAIIESAYKRLKLAKSYEPQFMLKSEIILIKGKPYLDVNSLSVDYNLSKYTKAPVKVFNIPSEKTSVLDDCKVPNIVNRMLDSHLLERFKTECLCETYQSNGYN